MKHYTNDTAVISLAESGEYSLLAGSLTTLDRDELGRVTRGTWEQVLEDAGVAPASVVTDADGETYSEYTVEQYLRYIGWTECGAPVTVWDRVTDLVDGLHSRGLVDRPHVHHAATGSAYITLTRVSDEAQLVVRVADHDECYPPARGVEQITVDRYDAAAFERVAAKVEAWAIGK